MERIEEDTWVCLEDNRNESKIVKVNEKKYTPLKIAEL
jgi:hypothetical protein